MKTTLSTIIILSSFTALTFAKSKGAGQMGEQRDCAEIQAKVDAAAAKGGGKVLIEAGTYVCQEPIIIQNDNIELVGATSGTPPTSGLNNIGALNLVKIKVADGRNCPAIVIGSPDTLEKRDAQGRFLDFYTPKQVKNVKVRNLNVDGNKDKQTEECWEGKKFGGCTQGTGKNAIRNNGITIRGAEDIEVSEVVLNNNRSGGMVTEKHCKRLKVTRMKSEGNFFDGFAGYQTEDSEFNDSELKNNLGAGASLDIYFSKNKFNNVTFQHNAHQGVFARSLDSLTFENSRIQDNGYQGLFFAPSEVGPCPTKMVLRNTVISGSGRVDPKLGQGLRLADPSCTQNCLENVEFKNNLGGDVSWASRGSRPGSDEVDPKTLECQNGKDVPKTDIESKH